MGRFFPILGNGQHEQIFGIRIELPSVGALRRSPPDDLGSGWSNTPGNTAGGNTPQDIKRQGWPNSARYAELPAKNNQSRHNEGKRLDPEILKIFEKAVSYSAGQASPNRAGEERFGRQPPPLLRRKSNRNLLRDLTTHFPKSEPRLCLGVPSGAVGFSYHQAQAAPVLVDGAHFVVHQAQRQDCLSDYVFGYVPEQGR